MFKVTSGLILKSIHQLFSKNKDIHSHNTRNKNLLIKIDLRKGNKLPIYADSRF